MAWRTQGSTCTFKAKPNSQFQTHTLSGKKVLCTLSVKTVSWSMSSKASEGSESW